MRHDARSDDSHFMLPRACTALRGASRLARTPTGCTAARARVAAVHGMQTPPRRDIAAEQHAAATGEACTFVCISDTHSKHADMAPLPPGDVLLHAGDMTVNGSLEEVLDFAAWWHAQPHAQKFIIAGNHDRVFEDHPQGLDKAEAELRAQAEAALSGRGSVYLRDSAATTARGGFRVWGAPWQPRFWGAFNVRRGRDIAAKWAACPPGVDVVITHGPAAGHGDFVPRKGEHVGCEDLLRKLLGRVRPAVAVCGHIHEDAGVSWQAGHACTFINASTCTLQYEALQPPVVFTLRRGTAGEGGAVCVHADVAGHPRPALQDAALGVVASDGWGAREAGEEAAAGLEPLDAAALDEAAAAARTSGRGL